MIKLVFSLRRRPDLTRDEFQAHWRDPHAQLVSRHADALRIRRYVQTHARASEVSAAQSAARGSEPDVYDGQAELWWDSLDDIVAAVSTPAGQQAAAELLEDERRFIDLERSPLWIGEEQLVVGQAPAAAPIAARAAGDELLGVKTTLASAHRARLEGEAAAFARLDSDMADLFETEDGREGLRSFVERREATFAGR